MGACSRALAEAEKKPPPSWENDDEATAAASATRQECRPLRATGARLAHSRGRRIIQPHQAAADRQASIRPGSVRDYRMPEDGARWAQNCAHRQRWPFRPLSGICDRYAGLFPSGGAVWTLLPTERRPAASTSRPMPFWLGEPPPDLARPVADQRLDLLSDTRTGSGCRSRGAMEMGCGQRERRASASRSPGGCPRTEFALGRRRRSRRFFTLDKSCSRVPNLAWRIGLGRLRVSVKAPQLHRASAIGKPSVF
jgi:hypothetical protein